MAKTKAIDFEATLAELEQLVQRMESGELNLEDSLKAFEQGMELSKNCQQALSEAEQKVQILLANENQDATNPL
ncbi:exodeoxyribonuclease VII small subunit [Spongiibacter sp. KMU-158]|uniref:Exodeoxyribonuclease 7 small subunit n=1 Tax=Spongiibacter pelagi TaxID=2760804 RepID=A0A927C0T0_9GAMM|nr:exodeoxyribonuclease VII small subunit [Spongiibacter pelagi]MBD2857787.1 exodeoxyribonuclease VII small subunit [Spongiibacter pelagi]